MHHTAGTGLTLLQVYDAIFGTSKAAKAFRSVVKKINKDSVPLEALGDQFPLASQVVRVMADSQEFKAFFNQTNMAGFGFFKDVRDPYRFLERMGPYLPDLKKWLEVELNRAAPKIMAATKKFLLEWVNTNGRRLPQVTSDLALDLAPFRPISRLVLYRGIQFSDVGELVEFTQKYGSGEAFTFNSDRWSSWTKSPGIAERFARYHASASHFSGMMSFFSRAEKKKDYDGKGGYVVGAYVQPKDCLVDLTHPGLPFDGGQHGNEGEVIVRPNVDLVCKVYKVYGDVLREIEEFQKDKFDFRESPESLGFFGYLSGYTPEVHGDGASGIVKFLPHRSKNNARVDLQKELTRAFRRNLYTYEWIDDNTVRYKRMNLPSRVASRYLSL